MASTKALAPKQAAFVREYLIDLNATQAAIRAGYSEKTAYSQGQRLLKDVEIASAIQEAQNERAKRTLIEADSVLLEIARLAFVDPGDLFDEQGRLLPIKKMPDGVRRAVSSVEVVTRTVPGSEPVEVEHTSKIKFWDKRGSLELLGKHLKLFTDKVEHSGKVEVETKDVSDTDLARRIAFILTKSAKET